MNKLSFSMGTAALVAMVLAACSASTTNPTTANAASIASIALSDCRVKSFDGVARCATVSVPEDHAQPNGQRIEIFLAVLPSLARRPQADPLFLFAGGPGQAASDLGRLAGAFNDVRKLRPIVLVDQRGTGKSKTLTCDATNAAPANDPLIEMFNADAAAVEKDWAKCLATMKGNPATHRTDDYIDDLELIRKGLGYDKINVWGGSYGSRVALRYMKRFPSSIRSAVLDGVAPTTLRLPDDAMANSEAQLKAAIAACEQSSACASAYPNLAATLDALLNKLRLTPQAMTLNHPATGKPLSGIVTDRTVISFLWPLLYQPEAARLIPTLIHSGAAGNFSPMAATTTASSISETDVSLVQRFAVMCAEDMLGRTAPAMDRFKSLSELFYGFCKSMPHGKVAPEFFEPTTSDIPTLLFSGTLDPVTPPSQGVLAAKTLAQSKHVVVGGMGHIVSIHPCSRRLMGKFIEVGSISAAKNACEPELSLPRPLFYVNALEAQP
jgi:pimeloyl-ACP methyl ester carboxylesterase